MKVNNLSKVFMALALSVSLASCTNNTEPTASADSTSSENQNTSQAVDMIDEASDEKIEETENEAIVTEDVSNEAENTESEKTTIEVEKPEENQDNSKVEASADNSNEDNKELQEKDGSYTSTLLSEKNGERDPASSYASAYDLIIKDGILTTKGSFDYRLDPENYEEYEELENNEYSFKIDENTEFLSGGGLAEPSYYTVDEFNTFYQEVKDSGLGLVIEVENGIVKTVSIVS